MKSARKSLRPANDFQQAYALQKMPRVLLVRPFWDARLWDVRRIASFCVLAVFIIIFGAAGTGIFSSAPLTQKITLQKTTSIKKSAPYDIRIEGAALTAPDEATRLAQTLPLHVLITKHHAPPHAPSSAMSITVETEKSIRILPQQDAANFAALAQNAIEQGDLHQAIRFQRRAVAAAPDAVRYVLALAVMLDHAGDTQGATSYYQQIVDAYTLHADSLPAAANINSIRQRLAYLEQIATR